MDELQKLYARIGSHMAPALSRMGGDAGMLRHFVERFLEDESFCMLASALVAGSNEEAFRAAHTLKGICATLGFDTLFSRASQVTELLRSNDLQGAIAAFPALEQAYEAVVEAIGSQLSS